jgi:chromosome segregation ATPase
MKLLLGYQLPLLDLNESGRIDEHFDPMQRIEEWVSIATLFVTVKRLIPYHCQIVPLGLGRQQSTPNQEKQPFHHLDPRLSLLLSTHPLVRRRFSDLSLYCESMEEDPLQDLHMLNLQTDEFRLACWKSLQEEQGLKELLKRCQNELEYTEQELENSKQEIENSKQELENSRHELENSRQELENSRQELENSRQLLGEARQQLANISATLKEERDNISRLSCSEQSLQEKLAIETTAHRASEAQLLDVQKRLSDLHDLYIKLRDKSRLMREDITQLESDRESDLDNLYLTQVELEEVFDTKQAHQDLCIAQAQTLQRAQVVIKKLSAFKGVPMGSSEPSIQVLALLEGYRHSLKRAERLLLEVSSDAN